MIVEIEGKQGLVRDISSGAVLNTNRADYENFLARKKLAKSQKEQLAAQADEINNIKSDISEIKQMLLALLNK